MTILSPSKSFVNKRAQCDASKSKLKAYFESAVPLACRLGLQVTAVATVFYTAELNSLVLKQNRCNTYFCNIIIK